ncbi:MAG: hypothetical protein K5898_04755 [Ruminococcus sp.]|uniref:hypothetical protein n=1 Tax=Ruminococcus sp. TaxID=41978 RepID=UPI0025FAE9FC|nr:hypothetical protein [Ruminococcus sp.]MCR4794467.1 hypothetical protein [Ruminococcus sp.]
MEKYYFRKFQEWIKEIRKEKNLKYTPDPLIWILLVAFLALAIAVMISMFFVGTKTGKIFFSIFLFLLAVVTAILVNSDNKQLKKKAFSGYATYKGVCEELIKNFSATFNVNKTEHYENILRSVTEKRDKLKNELNNPREKTGKLMIAVFVPVTVALLKEYFSVLEKAMENNVSPFELMNKNFIVIALIGLIVFFLAWVGTVFYSKSMNSTLAYYEEFIGFLKEIINIKKGFYDTKSSNNQTNSNGQGS